MQFQVLVLDYDGTVATDGALDPAVRAAIAEFRAGGRVVILATGRLLDELEQVAGDLHFVDAAVAENGAIVTFPADRRSLMLGHEPPEAFLAVLSRRGVAAARRRRGWGGAGPMSPGTSPHVARAASAEVH